MPREDRTKDRNIKFEVTARIISELLHEAILLDWENFEDNDGNPIPYSPEMAETLCTDPQYRPFQDAVVWASNTLDNVRTEDKEELAGNSEKSSAGKSGATAKKTG